MSEITISINGRNYDITCDKGQEGRVLDLATYVDQRVRDISQSGAAYNDSHLLVLATLFLSNEILEAREGVAPDVTLTPPQQDQTELEQQYAAAQEALAKLEAEKEQVMSVVEQLTERVEGLTQKVEAF